MAEIPTNIPLGPEAIPPASAEVVKSMTGASLEALKKTIDPVVGATVQTTRAGVEKLMQTVGPAIVPTLTIAGLALIYYYAIKAIITGKNPLKSGAK